MTTPESTTWGNEQASRLEAVYAQLVSLLGDRATAQPADPARTSAEWSTTEILGHLVEMIPYWLASCRTILAAPEPPVFGRALDAPERLAGVEQGSTAPAVTLLAQLESEVRAAAAAMRALTVEERGKKGRHLLRGEMTVAEIIETTIVTHAEGHLAQVRAALA
jgi:hypothetical protein